jgi:hypothetical protein
MDRGAQPGLRLAYLANTLLSPPRQFLIAAATTRIIPWTPRSAVFSARTKISLVPIPTRRRGGVHWGVGLAREARNAGALALTPNLASGCRLTGKYPATFAGRCLRQRAPGYIPGTPDAQAPRWQTEGPDLGRSASIPIGEP